MEVKAKFLGYSGGMLREPGSVFDLTDDKNFSDYWMEKVGGEPTPANLVADDMVAERKKPGRPRANP